LENGTEHAQKQAIDETQESVARIDNVIPDLSYRLEKLFPEDQTMSRLHLIDNSSTATDIIPLLSSDLRSWLKDQSPQTQRWVAVNSFAADAHAVLRIPGEREAVLLGLGDREDRWSFSGLPLVLPKGDYRICDDYAAEDGSRAALGWALGCYQFNRYRASDRELPNLCWPKHCDRPAVTSAAEAIFLARDLANVPASDMGPAELADAATALAADFGAKCSNIVGDALLENRFGLIHAVGRASSRAPRLVDMTWGNPEAPKVTLIGKGVCFDTGGINIKAWAGMINMKVDMGGGAHVLALARMVMSSGINIRLRVLIPAVDNSISGNAMMPKDIVTAYNGVTVEIGHTDAEGRLVLADALAVACEDKPAVILDFATLTSTSTVALGPDLPALYSNNDQLAGELQKSARATDDPFWRMPLWRDYLVNLKGKTADLNSTADINMGFTSAAGAIYASLFLDSFVDRDIPWAHFDLNAWNLKTRPGRPEGGEARCLLAAYDYLKRSFGAD
jgi:leucyl aminopeptidase